MSVFDHVEVSTVIIINNYCGYFVIYYEENIFVQQLWYMDKICRIISLDDLSTEITFQRSSIQNTKQ